MKGVPDQVRRIIKSAGEPLLARRLQKLEGDRLTARPCRGSDHPLDKDPKIREGYVQSLGPVREEEGNVPRPAASHACPL